MKEKRKLKGLETIRKETNRIRIELETNRLEIIYFYITLWFASS